MRRIIAIGASLAVLASAGVALAAAGTFNSYGAAFSFSSRKAGGRGRPVPVGFSEKLTARSRTPGERAAPLTEITTYIYGVVSDGKDFPKCTQRKITASHTRWDKACPRGSMVAEGPVSAILGPGSDPTNKGTPCNPYLHVYDGGQNRLWFFFTIFGRHQCAGLKTGASAPYEGFISRRRGYLVTKVPLPPDVSTEAGGLRGVYGALIHENLRWFRLTKRVHGKTVAANASIACKNGRRPWKVVYTAQNYNFKSGSNTVTGSAKC